MPRTATLLTCVTVGRTTLCSGLTVDLLADAVSGPTARSVVSSPAYVRDGEVIWPRTVARVHPGALALHDGLDEDAIGDLLVEAVGDCYCDEIADARAGHP